MNIKTHIPNSLTLANLFCGCCAILAILNNQFEIAFWHLIAAGIFDFADGLVARALGVSSPLGKELDSLADMVSFGVVPGMFYYSILRQSDLADFAFLGFVVTLFSALRLAKFNLDTRQTTDFIGLNTPSNTFFVVGFVFAIESWGLEWLSNPFFIFGLIGITSYLLVSEIRMFGFKINQLTWKGNELRIIFLGLAIPQFLLLGKTAFASIILTYLILSIIFYRKK